MPDYYDTLGVKKGASEEEIKARTDALQQAFHGVSERMYQQAAQAQTGADGAGNGAAADGAQDEEVVDAEVVDEGNK